MQLFSAVASDMSKTKDEGKKLVEVYIVITALHVLWLTLFSVNDYLY